MKNRTHKKPTYLKNKPSYHVYIPWGALSGNKHCPCRYYTDLEAAVHSLLAGMKCEKMEDVQSWMLMARTQLNAAIRASKKPGATVPVEGVVYPDPEENL